MTLEEAKKILEKEGFVVERFLGVLVEDVKTASWEKIEVSEAMRVVVENGYLALMEESKYKERKARLKKECENNTKAPVFGEVEAGDSYLKKATDAFILQANEIMRLKKKNAELLEAIDNMKEGSPALAESASQFNDALLDEQAKKIKRLGKEIARLNGIIHDKNAILSDVAEELRLTKIREKNLVEVSQKYMKENEELKKKLADKVVDKIDAQALKSAESALAYKEKVIAEKDEVIADLTHELKAKHKKYVWYKGAYDAAQQILNTIADYAAKHPDKKFSDQMVGVDNAEEGKDHSAKVVLCGKDVVKKFKENEESVFNFFKRHKETAEELYEVADEALDQLLLFGEVIIKSEE